MNEDDSQKPRPGDRLTPTEKADLMWEQFVLDSGEPNSPGDLRHEDNLQVGRINHEVKRSYFSFNLNPREARPMAGLDIRYDYHHPDHIRVVKVYVVGDFPTQSNVDAETGGLLDVAQSSLEFSANIDPDKPQPIDLIEPITRIEAKFTRRGRQVAIVYSKGQLQAYNFSIIDPGPVEAGDIPEINSRWRRDENGILTIPLLRLNAIDVLVKQLRQAKQIEFTTPVGRITLTLGENDSIIQKRSLPTGQVADETTVSTSLVNPAEKIEALTGPDLLANPFGLDASHDHTWLHTDIMNLIGVGWTSR